MATTANDRWFDGAQWIVIGQLPATLVVPSAPTNLAVAPLQTQITVTWTVPGSNGGSAITGYTCTLTPVGGGATQTATVSPSTLTKIWTGLTANTTYTVTVAATNVVGTGPAASTNAQTSAASTSSVKYGPDGSIYPSFTPAINATVYATIALNDVTGLKAALQTVPSGQVILLSNGVWTAATINDATARAHLATLAQNVLIRPVTWGGATINMIVNVPRTSWMGFTLAGHSFSGYPVQSTNADRSRLAQCKVTGPLNITSVVDVELYELVRLVRGLDYDGLQINTENIATSPNAKIVSDYKIDRCWLAGCDASSGTSLHIDNTQILCQAGTNLIQRSYFGAGGNASTLSISADEQYTWTPGTTSVLNNYVEPAAQGINGFELKGTNVISIIAQGNELEHVVVNVGTSANKTLYDLTHITFDSNKLAAGGLIGNYNPPGPFTATFPNNTFSAVLTRPTFVNPPWWW